MPRLTSPPNTNRHYRLPTETDVMILDALANDRHIHVERRSIGAGRWKTVRVELWRAVNGDGTTSADDARAAMIVLRTDYYERLRRLDWITPSLIATVTMRFTISERGMSLLRAMRDRRMEL